jgi:hypothetical protein
MPPSKLDFEAIGKKIGGEIGGLIEANDVGLSAAYENGLKNHNGEKPFKFSIRVRLTIQDVLGGGVYCTPEIAASASLKYTGETITIVGPPDLFSGADAAAKKFADGVPKGSAVTLQTPGHEGVTIDNRGPGKRKVYLGKANA